MGEEEGEEEEDDNCDGAKLRHGYKWELKCGEHMMKRNGRSLLEPQSPGNLREVFQDISREKHGQRHAAPLCS